MTDLDARYGRRPPMAARRRRLLGIAGVIALVVVSVVVTELYLSGRPKASAEVLGSQVVSDQAMRATVLVTKPKGRTAACEIRALDQSLTLVGTVRVAAEAAGTQVRIEVTIPTTSRAVGARAGDCVLDLAQ